MKMSSHEKYWYNGFLDENVTMPLMKLGEPQMHKFASWL
jgi:hypothetical protein